nr:hypothetical protein Iba_chr08eCG1720 [Ipomoea batatas]
MVKPRVGGAGEGKGNDDKEVVYPWKCLMETPFSPLPLSSLPLPSPAPLALGLTILLRRDFLRCICEDKKNSLSQAKGFKTQKSGRSWKAKAMTIRNGKSLEVSDGDTIFPLSLYVIALFLLQLLLLLG